MPIQLVLNANEKNGHKPVKIFTSDVDPQALQQLKNMAALPFVYPHIAVMPDVHVGIGATVGSVIPSRGAIVPAAVGVDIGCGMNAVRLSLNARQLPDNPKALRTAIERAVPVGFDQHARETVKASSLSALDAGIDRIVAKHPGLLKMLRQFRLTWARQLGTLGGGNHFIEICLDETEAVWVMLHSGSRGIGNCIGRYFIELARKDMSREYGHLPDKDLSYLVEGTQHFADYIEAVSWAQDYAMLNRREMMRLVVESLKPVLPPFELTREAINCHHNYVERESHFGEEVYITRKGAISAQEGQLGIIPGSMGAKSFIVRGKGNAESFCSCSHGAGRRMSRMEAKRRFSTQDMVEQTEGVECRKDKGVVDEIPAAYKDIDAVMAHQSDLVEVVHTLRQIVCVKG
ncbi:tRNA-splicing ligase RtcB [Fluviicoccus keumensis]|uniref:3'-phosphate/5'-hydroxy nucleic acid ligase n=1 Tax=Fluviicoccus keumensis TaxID=1435465 RepID=A0A4Q7Z9U8_9GAMM|nr:RtcB family protein [Fluviicoccus keumensis]RZU47310.1 tRNA-splicing ligase RtcB [Fluviicoccus keumensis]